MDDETLGKLLAEVHRDYADYRRPEGVSVSPSSMSVMVDRTGKPVERSDSDQFGFSVRNMYSAQFPVITQAERMVDRTGKPVEEISEIAKERESSSAQIRTLFRIGFAKLVCRLESETTTLIAYRFFECKSNCFVKRNWQEHSSHTDKDARAARTRSSKTLTSCESSIRIKSLQTC